MPLGIQRLRAEGAWRPPSGHDGTRALGKGSSATRFEPHTKGVGAVGAIVPDLGHRIPFIRNGMGLHHQSSC